MGRCRLVQRGVGDVGVILERDRGMDFVGEHHTTFRVDYVGQGEKFTLGLDTTERVVGVAENHEVSALIEGGRNSLEVHLQASTLPFDHGDLDDLSPS